MLDSLISLIAPHACLSCKDAGSLLCSACSDDFIEARLVLCLLCGVVCGARGLCEACALTLPVERAFLFGERGGVLETLVNQFKFDRKRAAYKPVSRLLASVLPYRLPGDAVIVPLPTVAKHVRQRGYDHTLLIARSLARMKRINYERLLRRHGSSVQRGASKRERIIQAERAFVAVRPLDPTKLYILVDDIITTGASVRAASRAIKQAGATRIWVLALARQPLDEQR